MGVISETIKEDAQEQASDTTTSDGDGTPDADVPDVVSADLDPFIQEYVTGQFDVESDKLDEMLSIAIAIGNLL